MLSIPFLPKKRHHYKRLFGRIPDPEGKKVIWIHAVSVGEIKAAKTFCSLLQNALPDYFFLITTTTATGLAEAFRCMPKADAIALFPFDFSWIVRKWVRKLAPELFLAIENDIWPHLLIELKRAGTKAILVSGKMSARSFKRFCFFPKLSRKLFSLFDHLFVQNEEHAKRFFKVLGSEGKHPSPLKVTGNLKLDYDPEKLDVLYWKSYLSIPDRAVTIACTHEGEEELLLDALIKEPIFFFLAPRHPERFELVAQLLDKKGISFFRWSALDQRKGGEKVLLMDCMGKLPICYSLSRLAILGGSFISGIGGHNVLEPIFYEIPVIFGPDMSGQKEFAAKVLEVKAGMQLPVASLAQEIREFFNHPEREASLKAAANSLAKVSKGSSARAVELIMRVLEEKSLDVNPSLS